MPTQLNPGFQEYLNKLPITRKSRNNYRQYVRWIERFGSGEVNLDTMKTEADIERFLNGVAQRYDDAHPTGLRFNSYRRSDAKCIIRRHYFNFLRFGNVEATQDKLEEAGEFNVSSQEEGKEKVFRSIALRRGQRKFREKLLEAYKGSCAVTGTRIEDVLEAAHIMPYNGASTNHVCNGLLLRSDIHALFDLGLLSVDPKGFRVHCSDQIRGDAMYDGLHGETLRMPASANQKPDREALRVHFERRLNRAA